MTAQRFVISAAHCYCSKIIPEMKCIFNDARRGPELESGHYTWVNSTQETRIDYDPSEFVSVVTPGYYSDYR